MGAVWVNLSSLAHLHELVAAGKPQLIKFTGVAEVRSAPGILGLVDTITDKVVPVAEGEEAIYNYLYGGSGKNHFGLGSSSSSSDEEVHDADEAAAAAADDDDDEDKEYWTFEGLPEVRRVAVLAKLAAKLADEVLPALASSPADLCNLKSLREVAMEVRRLGRLEAGAAGARAVTLANRAHKIARRARRHSAIAYRDRQGCYVSRASYVGERPKELTDKVNALLDASVDFVPY